MTIHCPFSFGKYSWIQYLHSNTSIAVNLAPSGLVTFHKGASQNTSGPQIAAVWTLMDKLAFLFHGKQFEVIVPSRFKIQDSNTFIHQNYTISTWIDTLALVMNNFRILSMSPSYNRWYGDPY